MSFKFSQKDIKSLVHVEKTNFTFPDNIAQMSIRNFPINKDICLYKVVIHANNDFCFYSEPSSQKYGCLHYQLEGNTISVGKSSKEATHYHKQKSSLYIINKESFFHNFFQGKTISLGILLSDSMLENILPHSNKIVSTKKITSKTTNLAVSRLLKDIYSCQYNDKLSEMYIQSKVLEIIYIEFYSLQEKKPFLRVKIDEQDIEALHKAKKILIASYDNPPSIISLAKMVSMNDYKLKYGFKAIFNATPYQFVLDYRLKKAKILLEKGDMNVTEIAKTSGYKHVQSFSVAFLKHFGISPKSINKNKKYYY